MLCVFGRLNRPINLSVLTQNTMANIQDDVTYKVNKKEHSYNESQKAELLQSPDNSHQSMRAPLVGSNRCIRSNEIPSSTTSPTVSGISLSTTAVTFSEPTSSTTWV